MVGLLLSSSTHENEAKNIVYFREKLIIKCSLQKNSKNLILSAFFQLFTHANVFGGLRP